MRCERCRTSELTLETFGIYRCPVCGRVDADGNLVGGEPADRADSTQPTLLETGRASFAAPPPAPAPSPIAASLTPTTSTPSREMPRIFLVTLAITALIDVVGAMAGHSACSLVGLIVFYGGLLTGKPWARTVSMAGAVLTIGGCAMLFVLVHASPQLRTALAVVIAANAWWLYVLVRPDTVSYFTR